MKKTYTINWTNAYNKEEKKYNLTERMYSEIETYEEAERLAKKIKEVNKKFKYEIVEELTKEETYTEEAFGRINNVAWGTAER